MASIQAAEEDVREKCLGTIRCWYCGRFAEVLRLTSAFTSYELMVVSILIIIIDLTAFCMFFELSPYLLHFAYISNDDDQIKSNQINLLKAEGPDGH